MSIRRLYPGFKKSFKHNNVRKNLFQSAFFCWDSRLSLREKDEKFKFVGTIELHDAAGAVSAYGGKGLCYCYLIGRGPNSCLQGLVTGLLLCL